MKDSVTDIAAWKALQEVAQVITEAQSLRGQLGECLILPDLLIDMTKVWHEISDHHRGSSAAPGTHTTLTSWHALFQAHTEFLANAFVSYTHGLPFMLRA